nr:methylenetetrahydrofolate--tRNA-(uracil(54)-C(5))-methyltransferase (FADH(2)-oxidizing) TrmFO [Woodsholea maritima]
MWQGFEPHAQTRYIARMSDLTPLHIIGGGMAGSEAAWQAAEAGVPVILHEMRGVRGTEAHKTDGLAELVCSNSFRSDDAETNAVGLLHEEMRRCNSLIMAMADRHQVPAGGALAVDRDAFSQAVTQTLTNHPNVEIRREVFEDLPPADWSNVIIATGPLTHTPLAEAIHALTGEGELAFFDAIAPIIYADSINMDVAWKQSRYDKGDDEADKAAYINCPMDEAQYNAFLDALLNAEKTEFKDWEKDTPYFEACLPIEVMAERGRETLRFGPMKPRGLTNAHNPSVKPHAVVQLRQDNSHGTLFNMVGFQTKMKYGAQGEVFKMIPGLEEAQFARLGGIHRNTFLNSPRVLDGTMRLKARPSLRFAGQITGVEGYVESAAMGLITGRFAACDAKGEAIAPPPATTALGALLAHVTTNHVPGKKGAFQPMNVNYGLFPDIEGPTKDADGKRLRGKEKTNAKKRAMSARALVDLAAWSTLSPLR